MYANPGLPYMVTERQRLLVHVDDTPTRYQLVSSAAGPSELFSSKASARCELMRSLEAEDDAFSADVYPDRRSRHAVR